MIRRGCLVISAILALHFIPGCREQKSAATPRAQLDAGWDAYRLGQYQTAIAAFQSAADSASEGSDERAHALYGLATTWNLRRPDNDPDKAAALYTTIVKGQTTPATRGVAAWSQLALARMKHVVGVDAQPDYAELRKAYESVIALFPKHPAADEAFIHQQSTYLISLSADDARIAVPALQTFVAERGGSPLLSAAWLLLSQAHDIMKEPEKALHARIRALETEEEDETNPTDKALTYWRIATIAEFDAGDFQTARKYYNLLINEYHNDIRLFGARTALKRMDELEAKIRSELRAAK